MGSEKVKKPIYKRWWFILIAAFIITAAIGAALDTGEKPNKASETPANAPSNETPETSADKEKEEEVTKEIIVTMDVKEIADAGKVQFEGTTNLPDGTELLASLSNNDGYGGQSQVVVNNGKFKTEEFSKGGKALESGTYKIEILMPIASVQPEPVKELIGENSENLKGEFVKDGDLGKIVEFSKEFEIQGAEKADHSDLVENYKTQINDYYKELNNEYEKHKKSFDLAAWGEFARSFRESTTELRDEISESVLNPGDRILLGPACADLQMLLTAYASDLQGRGDSEEVKRLKGQIEEVINQ